MIFIVNFCVNIIPYQPRIIHEYSVVNDVFQGCVWYRRSYLDQTFLWFATFFFNICVIAHRLRHWPNIVPTWYSLIVCLMLGRCCRRRDSIYLTLGEPLILGCVCIIVLSFILEKGTWRSGRAPDCLDSHACVPGSNPAHPVEKYPFSSLFRRSR